MTSQRISVVTGGASGIGRAAAIRLATAGDWVVIADINQNGSSETIEKIERDGGDASFVRCDVGEEEQLADLADAVERDVGTPGVLVNSAGLLQNPMTTAEMDMEEHDRIWRVNYRGTYLACRAFAPRMAAGGGGAIVNVGSINSFFALPLPAYNPGKFAIKGLTELLACEWGPKGVRVNMVAPGYTLTENIRARIESGHRDPEALVRASPLRTAVEPADVAAAIAFLCSPDARMITGTSLLVDAGWFAYTGYGQYPGPVGEAG